MPPPAGVLQTSGSTQVLRSADKAQEAFRNALISLNRPAAQLGRSFQFRAGSQVCVPNFFSARESDALSP